VSEGLATQGRRGDISKSSACEIERRDEHLCEKAPLGNGRAGLKATRPGVMSLAHPE
jgi:hypothetical protein